MFINDTSMQIPPQLNFYASTAYIRGYCTYGRGKVIIDEQDFRASLSKEELERRAFIVPFKVCDFSVLERLNRYSTEFEKTWDELINAALIKFMDDIETVHNLRG